MAQAHLQLPAIERCGKYELLRRIDAGGMGEIYLAREQLEDGLLRLVALKRLLPQLAADPHYLQMFSDEASLASRIKHPGICEVFEVGMHGKEPYLAMEWVDGVPLATLLETAGTGGLPIPVVIRILIDVAAALHYTHRLRDEHGDPLQVIHRDISPPNIMVGFDGVVKLLDFGLAKARTQMYRTQPGYVKGKFRYLAPEQLDESREIDARIDVFGLGLCAWEAITGQLLFSHDSPVDAVQAIRRYQGPPELLALRSETPPALAAIVRRALARGPNERFGTAGAMQVALEQVLERIAPHFDAYQLHRYVSKLFPEETGDRAQRPSPSNQSVPAPTLPDAAFRSSRPPPAADTAPRRGVGIPKKKEKKRGAGPRPAAGRVVTRPGDSDIAALNRAEQEKHRTALVIGGVVLAIVVALVLLLLR